MRDWYICWICSIMFELLELTFRYWLPNFYECWWDSLLLDLFGCNFIGIVLGHYFLKYFGVSKIQWVQSMQKVEKNEQTEGSCENIALRILNKMTPSVFEKYEWSCLSSIQRYLGATVFIAVNLIVDCNNFFYKYLVWLPADHTLLKIRILLWGFCAIATGKEWYEYISNPNSNRLGPFAWLTFYVSLIEVSGVIKFRGTSFNASLPSWVYCMWFVISIFWSFGFYLAYVNGSKVKREAFDPYNPQVEIIRHGKKD